MADWLELPLQWLAAVYQGTAILFISLFSSLFCLPVFRILLPLDLLRFWFTLGLLLRHEYALHTFINFSYYGAIPFFLILLSYPFLPRLKTTQQLVWGFLFLLLGTSKALYLCFLPVVGILTLASIKIKTWRANLIILIEGITGLLIQFWPSLPD